MDKKLWYIYTMEYYSAIKKNTFESVLMRWMKLEPIIQSEVIQKEKQQDSILTHIYGIFQARVLEWGAIAFSSSKFHIYVLIYCIGVFLSDLLHSV